jgi:hypothetical protein
MKRLSKDERQKVLELSRKTLAHIPPPGRAMWRYPTLARIARLVKAQG